MQLRYKIAIYVFLFWLGMMHSGYASEPEVRATGNVVSSAAHGVHGGVQ
jgi:hypothetical protein